MKIQVTFKNPDALDYALRDFIDDNNPSDEEIKKAKELFEKFFEYGEYARIEIDLDTGEATVVTDW